MDVDGDGDTEIVAGRNAFHRRDADGREWDRERLVPDWANERVRVVVADLDGDSKCESVLSEYELLFFGERRDIHHDACVTVCEAPD